MNYLLSFPTLISVFTCDSASQFKMVCNEEKGYFLNFNTDCRISLWPVHAIWGMLKEDTKAIE